MALYFNHQTTDATSLFTEAQEKKIRRETIEAEIRAGLLPTGFVDSEPTIPGSEADTRALANIERALGEMDDKAIIANAKTSGQWDEQSIKALLSTSDKAVCKALSTIYRNQTADEQSGEMTIHHNSRGFNGLDARFLSSLAKQYNERGTLSAKQISAARPKLMKYWKQLLAAIPAKA